MIYNYNYKDSKFFDKYISKSPLPPQKLHKEKCEQKFSKYYVNKTPSPFRNKSQIKKVTAYNYMV